MSRFTNSGRFIYSAHKTMGRASDILDAIRKEGGTYPFEDFCDEHEIEPYQWDVFEHWIVSNWLAEKLEAKGEKVDADFAGLTVWARTTTGQSIAMDAVIQAIAADLAKA